MAANKDLNEDLNDYFSKFSERKQMENGFENWVLLDFMQYKEVGKRVPKVG